MANQPTYGVLMQLPVKSIYPHPDNPRKDLGDLTELAESIRVNGVLQNLTVVPRLDETSSQFDGEYTVVIGHRRLAAAKIAERDTVPCIAADMTDVQQIRAMLTENIQRSDLTVYEQAQGFQLMLDLGDSPSQIAERCGFSETTVRRRVKLLELDKKKFKKATARGATLADFAELEKITDAKRKDEVLDTIGTANFANALKSALDMEQFKRDMEAWEAVLATYATKTEDLQGLEFVSSLGMWTSKNNREHTKPDDADTVRYFYRVSERCIDVYKEKPENEELTEEEKQRIERTAESNRIHDELKAITKKQRDLRSDFVRDLKAVKKHVNAICRMSCDAIIGDGRYNIHSVASDLLEKLLGLTPSEGDTYEDIKERVSNADENHDYKLLAVAYAALDNGTEKYYTSDWNANMRCYVYKHAYNPDLDMLYEYLTDMGYEMSDEEKAMQDGTHELLHME